METANIQNMTEKDITMVALANIQPSSYNPRKHFDETSLAELAESIRRQGVLQPIGVRPLADIDRMEIVFGERRYRAALMAELAEIPAVILHVSDETAAEMAVTENLQRKDVTPIEEANAYQKLMESGRYDVQSLAVQFGKNENYIRTRLKFVSLIPEIAELLEKDEITISVASEICRYGTDIQKEVYYRHLEDSDSMLYDSWRGLKAADVAKFIERDFTTDLNHYAFDKTLCASCPHNTNNMMLFCEGGCGNCANRSCLAEMNASYLVEKAVQFVEQYPSVSLCYQDFNNNMVAVERLTAMGYEVEHLNTYATAYPETPVAPEKEEYDTTEEYETAYKEYEQDFSNYMEKCKSIHERIDTGELTFYIRIGQNEITLCYMASAAANTDMATEKQLSPVEKLEQQDKRNKEIAVEKTVADAKKQILDVDTSESKFTQDEEKMIYFFLLSSLRREHFGVFGIGEKKAYQHLEDEEKMNIIANLTAKQKAVIRRDFLIDNFKGAYGNNAAATLLLDFARKHMPDTLAEIENGYNEVYEKRHKRIEERKAALLAKERQTKPEEAAEAENTQPTAEVQPEEHTQPEEVAA
ncbi:ParB/RepB/Spo0J family partition protein [Bacteroides fragilis]|uniref:ParB/RepB/Spo0J family partition protein n=1 Tax=Bacteroides TaxID=816 RepID=UPI0022AA4180|nr:ParB/RepB/Spo0J family partition protein [Bacteroides fragilis]MCZ2611932.1 ParB/RepB/Spo0J family partition protein [Bacteroides fragilis]